MLSQGIPLIGRDYISHPARIIWLDSVEAAAVHDGGYGNISAKMSSKIYRRYRFAGPRHSATLPLRSTKPRSHAGGCTFFVCKGTPGRAAWHASRLSPTLEKHTRYSNLTLSRCSILQDILTFQSFNRSFHSLQVENKEELDKEQWWRVILHNDEIHTFDYVTQSITKVRAVGGDIGEWHYCLQWLLGRFDMFVYRRWMYRPQCREIF